MKKLKYLIFTLLLTFVGMSGIKAATTDFSNLTYKIIGINNTSQLGAQLEISGVDFDWENIDYGIYIKNGSSTAPELITDLTMDGVHLLSSATQSVYIDRYLELSGDIYVTMYEEDTTGYVKATETVKIDRPAALALGSRIKAGFASSGDVITVLVPNEIDERRVNYKIGQITDNNILSNIKNGKSTAISDLLNYAKNASNAKTGTLAVGLHDDSIIDSLGLTDKKYYYVYLELDNENGKYYDVEDVWIYQSSVFEDGKKYLLRYGDSGFKWNLEETEWEKFVKNFKENETLNMYEDGVLNIEYDSEKMVITVTDGENQYVTQFNYNNGIVSYQYSDSKTEGELFVDSIMQSIALQEFAKKFNYDLEKMSKYLEENKELTLSKNGIEYELAKFNIDESAEGSSVTIDGEYLKTLKFDLINGLLNYTEEDAEATVKNPVTGLFVGLGVVGFISVLSAGLYLLIRKKNAFPKA